MYEKIAKLQCPKCNSEMEKVEYEGIKIERCKKCKGIWFDMMEKDELKAKTGSEAVDIGDKELGKEYDKKKNVNCPKCLTPMVRKSDIEQKHIVYEYCNTCRGTFFDAGEFTDFKQETVLDYIKKIFIKK
jgi:Zn-finger nucleic acid-binding protein